MENRGWTKRDDLHRALGSFDAEFSTMVSRFRTAYALLVMGNVGVDHQWRFQVAFAGFTRSTASRGSAPGFG